MSFLDQIKAKTEPTQIISTLIAEHGGVTGLVHAFEQHGLAGAVQSWIGTGPNEPVNGSQVASVLGPDRIAGLAAKFGMNPQELQEKISTFLPQVIDKLSPNGQLNGEPSMVSRLLALGETALKSH